MQDTDKTTNVWSHAFLIWKITFGRWAVAWAGLWEKGVWANSEQHFWVFFFNFSWAKKKNWKHCSVRTEKLHWKKLKIFFGKNFFFSEKPFFLGLCNYMEVRNRLLLAILCMQHILKYLILLWLILLTMYTYIFHGLIFKKNCSQCFHFKGQKLVLFFNSQLRVLVLTLKFLVLKKSLLLLPKLFFDFFLPLFYATFQCGRYNVFNFFFFFPKKSWKNHPKKLHT